MADVKARALLAALSATWLALAACSRQGQDEMSWARAALERNDRLEIVAADPQSRTFTVRSKDTGELSMVRADQLVGGVAAPAALGAAWKGATTAPAASTASTGPAARAGAAAEAASAPAAAATPEAAGEASEPPVPSPPPPPKVFASRALQPGGQARPVPGQVLEAGPGYSIEAGSGATAAPASAPVLREPGAGSPAFEVRREPIVCQGARLLHIDNLNLQFEGDGVSAEDGCEIHITNSRIRATGVGVSARAADVHIDNSLIEGDTGSIDASDGAQIYTASSRFRGLSRQLDTAAVHDLGGNVWN
ncbi:MAG TPA: hypothetical protein VGR86_09150 [Steroidobacteraceae bacterium]|nr:hypothetical protein [Steroidobacteraceae bacterium]